MIVTTAGTLHLHGAGLRKTIPNARICLLPCHYSGNTASVIIFDPV
jgi:hypothetical protein